MASDSAVNTKSAPCDRTVQLLIPGYQGAIRISVPCFDLIVAR